MKAIICEKYGPPASLQLKEVPKPTPGENGILVKVNATAINDYDWCPVRGKPYPYRLLFGLLQPRVQIPGIELSGTVSEVGNNITAFNVGDAVYGDISQSGWGSFAEFVCTKETNITLKPESMSFEIAAAIPHAAMLASQSFFMIC